MKIKNLYRLFLAAVVLSFTLACGLFDRSARVAVQATTAALAATQGSAPIRDWKATEVSLRQTQTALEARPTATATPLGETVRPSGGQAYYWLQPDGCLAVETEDGGLVETEVCLPEDDQPLFSAAQRWISWSKSGATVPQLNENQLVILQPDATRLEVEGPDPSLPLMKVEGPDPSMPLVDAKLSPDGTTVFWLYNATRVVPNSMADVPCDAEQGCEGRVYTTYTSQTSGKLVWMRGFQRVTVPEYPYMEIAGWRNDSLAAYLRVNARVPGRYYADVGGGITQVNLPYGSSEEWSRDFLAFNTYVSPDGLWRVDVRDVDGGDELRWFSSDKPGVYRVAFDEAYNPLVFQVPFRNDGQAFYYLAMQRDGEAIRAMHLMRAGLDDEAAVETLYELEPLDVEDLPYITGLLSPNQVIVSNRAGSRFFDAEARTWLEVDSPAAKLGWALLGVVEE